MISDDTKACPFCGSFSIDYGYIPVSCYNCGAKGPQGYFGVDATWNTRPMEDKILKDKKDIGIKNE